MSIASALVALFAPIILQTPAGPLDMRRRYWAPHRPVGTPAKRRKLAKDRNGPLMVRFGKIETSERARGSYLIKGARP